MQSLGSVSNTPFSGATQSANSVTIRDLQKQYPELKLSAQTFASDGALRDYAMNQTGKYNVAIDPRAIERMGEDADFAAKMHGTLSGIKENEDWLEAKINSYPDTTMIACGTVIDKDGNASGWAISMSTRESEGMMSMSRKSREDLLERMETERKEKTEEAERIERRKAQEELRESLSVSVTTDITTEQTTAKGRGALDVTA